MSKCQIRAGTASPVPVPNRSRLSVQGPKTPRISVAHPMKTMLRTRWLDVLVHQLRRIVCFGGVRIGSIPASSQPFTNLYDVGKGSASDPKYHRPTLAMRGLLPTAGGNIEAHKWTTTNDQNVCWYFIQQGGSFL